MNQNQKSQNVIGPEIDPELVDLLDQIQETKPIKKPKVIKNQPKEEKVPLIEVDSAKSTPITAVIEPVDTQLIVEDVVIPPEDAEDAAKNEITTKILSINVDVLNSCEKDRDQIQSTIDVLYDRVQCDENTNRANIEQLVNALRAKAEINDTAVRASETLVKLLNATKKKEGSKTNNLNISAAGLKQLLNEDNNG